MHVFNFFKKEPKPRSEENNILLAMPMFNNGDRYKVADLIENLKSFWQLEVSDIGGDDEAASFMIDGETIALAYMPLQIPWDDIEGTAQYAYNWPRALEELKDHNGHAIVSIMKGQRSQLERFKILSKVLCSILITSESIGIYQGTESLLIPRKQYLSNIEELKEGNIPILLWIYIGLREFKTGNCAYTYGLNGFKKQEIEIIDSKLTLDELFHFMANIASYVIRNDVTLKNGETLGYTAAQKVPIVSTKGQFVKGQSFKLKI